MDGAVMSVTTSSPDDVDDDGHTLPAAPAMAPPEHRAQVDLTLVVQQGQKDEWIVRVGDDVPKFLYANGPASITHYNFGTVRRKVNRDLERKLLWMRATETTLRLTRRFTGHRPRAARQAQPTAGYACGWRRRQKQRLCSMGTGRDPRGCGCHALR